MTKITARGQVLKNIEDALTRLARNPMEVMTKVRVNAVASAIRTVWATWWGELDPVIRKYTEQPKGVPAGIDKSHERWAEFCEDAEAVDLLGQELTVDVIPLKLSELVRAEERADRKDMHFDVAPGDLDLLMQAGALMDDVSDTPAPEKPAKKPARKRAKAKE